MKLSQVHRIVLGAAILYATVCAILAVVLTEVAFHPKRTGVYDGSSKESQFGGKIQKVTVTSPDGIQLHGWFASPLKTNGDSVILLHGVGDNRLGMAGLAPIFLSKGYAILIPDSRGHGESGGIPTYGVRESGDVALWYGWLRTNNISGCVFGIGESMGAAILLQSLSRVPFCAVVAESSFASFRQVAYIRIGQLFNTGDWLGKTLLRPTVEFAFLYGWMTRGVWLSDASPERIAATSRVPVLLIHGLADHNIPIGQSNQIRDQNPDKIKLWAVPNAGHCEASTTAGSEFEERVVVFFATHHGLLSGNNSEMVTTCVQNFGPLNFNAQMPWGALTLLFWPYLQYCDSGLGNL
jgi:uncharacterized protein